MSVTTTSRRNLLVSPRFDAVLCGFNLITPTADHTGQRHSLVYFIVGYQNSGKVVSIG